MSEKNKFERFIPITITRARIRRIELTFNDIERKLEYEAVVDLMTPQDKVMTTVTLATNAWQDDRKIQVPDYLISTANVIRGEVEKACIECINGISKQLAAPEVKDEA